MTWKNVVEHPASTSSYCGAEMWLHGDHLPRDLSPRARSHLPSPPIKVGELQDIQPPCKAPPLYSFTSLLPAASFLSQSPFGNQCSRSISSFVVNSPRSLFTFRTSSIPAPNSFTLSHYLTLPIPKETLTMGWFDGASEVSDKHHHHKKSSSHHRSSSHGRSSPRASSIFGLGDHKHNSSRSSFFSTSHPPNHSFTPKI